MMETKGPVCLELRSVSLEARGSPILDLVDLTLRQGTRAMVMGSAGSGKSSLLKVCAGILIPDAGEVFLEGNPLSSLSRHDTLAFHRRCGFVFQDAALWSNQSLYENIAFPLRFHMPTMGGDQLDRTVRGAAELAGYSRSLSLRPAEVSGGERRLVGLARALVLDPEILFLDEPTVSLDEEETTRIIDVLVDLGKRGRTILIAGSSSDLAHRFAMEIGVMKKGRLVAWGSYDEAVDWDDPALIGAVGRLRPRPRAEGLLGAWAEAMTDEMPSDRANGDHSSISEDR